jgi:hypothetical protein
LYVGFIGKTEESIEHPRKVKHSAVVISNRLVLRKNKKLS